MSGAAVHIAIEGGDGAGKSAILQALRLAFPPDQASFITKANRPIRDLYRRLIAQHDTFPSPMQSFHLAMADYWHVQLLVEQSCRPVSISDRSFGSAYADAIALGIDPQFVLAVASAAPRPKMTVLLDVEPRAAWLRKQGQASLAEAGGPGGSGGSLEERFLTFQQAVRTAYGWVKEQGALGQEVLVVDTSAGIEQATREVAGAIARARALAPAWPSPRLVALKGHEPAAIGQGRSPATRAAGSK